MMISRSIGPGLVALSGLMLQACSPGEDSAPATEVVDCIDIPDGYYLFEDGKFSPGDEETRDALLEATAPPEPPAPQPQVPESRAKESDTYDWLSISEIGRVRVLTGTSPTVELREEAALSVQERVGARAYIVNAITVSGEPAPAGRRLTSLRPRPTRETCQSAANGLMEENKLRFSNNESAIADGSDDLMNAVAGLAMICEAYVLKIGVHTDARGAESYNQSRSERRAGAISAYLANAGIPDEQVSATGYGETQPLDASQTSEAYALNSRVELTFTMPDE